MWLERLTLIVTNCIKLAGVYVAIIGVTASKESAIKLAAAAFMMAGAQVSETAIFGFIERFFYGKTREQEQVK